ncbi:exo-alpha-sialidase [Pseudodesulfovibrio sp. JC047]|uniref:sialidase family protein n=1 Tax=Pseudodesulfovibrio sp. JC047 TaxID=2683199 RepID=UPI0013D8DE78|nr:sialidase family protein [Pseudodesulfovibrio sp. JC047]NDV19396.1 exo-alpha-sialidase [Pseudodesulfovibrio sp. JC047]
MASLSDDPTRHVVIDRRSDRYLAFPDVIRTPDNTLVVAYNEADKHVRPTSRILVVRTSRDNGLTWSEPIYPETTSSHCPRIVMTPSRDLIISDSSRVYHRSRDNGQSWEPIHTHGLSHDMHDRLMALGDTGYLTTGHCHIGSTEHPAIRQRPTQQKVFRSTDNGQTWGPWSILAQHRNLVLCEASMTRLPNGCILALMRENSFVFEPMYCVLSTDNGISWSAPTATPLIGHRPTLGTLPDGQLLVTYRNVGPDQGTCAWIGSVEELMSGFRVHGLTTNPANPTLTDAGLRIRTTPGTKSVVRYALRPMTDPRTATATLETDITVHAADANGCGIRLGTWWKLTTTHITPDGYDAQALPLRKGTVNHIQLHYANGFVTARVNHDTTTTIAIDPDHAETRPIMIGAPSPFEDNGVDCCWHRISLHVTEPAFDREERWHWTPRQGLPDQWVRDSVLELRNDRHAATPDFGYSGWTRLADGTFFCAYHHGGGTEPGYEPLHSSHIAGTRFSLEDF